MRVSTQRYTEDLADIELRLDELRKAVFSELEETESHVRDLRKTLEAIDRFVHSSREPESAVVRH